MLPLFTEYAKAELEKGNHPRDIVHTFFRERGGIPEEKEIVNELFRIMRLVERQVVLFDALEDSAFLKTHDLHGPGSIKDLVNRVRNSGKIADYEEFISNYSVRIVLTAHPTQFYTDEVLTILTDLGESLKHNDIRTIHELLLQMGQTRFKNREKPTPLEEAEGLMWALEHVMYRVVPEINQSLSEIDDQHRFRDIPKVLELGFWPGGDRDGNPYVTSDLTMQVGNLLRHTILRLYLRDFSELRRRLTFAGVISLVDRVYARLEQTLYPYSFVDHGFGEDQSCKDLENLGYENVEEFLSDLREMHKLIDEHHSGLFNERLEQFIVKVQSFGFHFATLDIRQDSSIHGRFFNELILFLEKKDLTFGIVKYLDLAPEDRIPTLLGLLELLRSTSPDLRAEWAEGLKRDLLVRDESVLADCIGSIEALSVIQKRNGTRGAHRYVISNTQGAHNVLEAWVLGLFGGMDPINLDFDIVPLFETIPDLHNAPYIMQQLYELEIYQSHLGKRNRHQTIMLGFSDGTKDGGYVTANWEIYKAKENLSAISRQYGYKVSFFDGRGGPPARGGGNTHKFYRSLGPDIDSSSIQLTIQGQTISSLYGTPESATFNLEQLVSAGIENNLFPQDFHSVSLNERELLNELSVLAQESYSELKSHPLFVSYLEVMTPLHYYGKTNIGSRPARRAPTKQLEFSNLRAIPFVGAWSQMKQNIPGFFGFGTALEKMSQNGKTDALKKLYRESLFFRTLVENSMQSLTKAYFPLTQYISHDEKFGAFWQIIYNEAERTTVKLLEVSGQQTLLESELSVKESINLRATMILPSLVIQQFALTRQREEPGNDLYEKLILKSLAASINASRNAV